MSSQVPEGDSAGEFGANEWLVDEMYELFQQDRNLVDQSWWAFLENYQPGAGPGAAQAATLGTSAAAQAASAAMIAYRVRGDVRP